ncbi:hypothetical protein RS9916_30639 [Synechococcus sp. RS9916]|nr:hypothetical protein RS9916_30639 [Synechococcus sp. RS9916]
MLMLLSMPSSIGRHPVMGLRGRCTCRQSHGRQGGAGGKTEALLQENRRMHERAPWDTFMLD